MKTKRLTRRVYAAIFYMSYDRTNLPGIACQFIELAPISTLTGDRSGFKLPYLLPS